MQLLNISQCILWLGYTDLNFGYLTDAGASKVKKSSFEKRTHVCSYANILAIARGCCIRAIYVQLSDAVFLKYKKGSQD